MWLYWIYAARRAFNRGSEVHALPERVMFICRVDDVTSARVRYYGRLPGGWLNQRSLSARKRP
jgi:hypothetical protein